MNLCDDLTLYICYFLSSKQKIYLSFINKKLYLLLKKILLIIKINILLLKVYIMILQMQ